MRGLGIVEAVVFFVLAVGLLGLILWMAGHEE